jgi:hypothetical protein
MEKLPEVNIEAEQYLRNAQPEPWAKAHFVGTRFGHDTSNVVLKLDPKPLIIRLLNAIWNRVMDLRFQRLEKAANAHVAEKWTPWARGKL